VQAAVSAFRQRPITALRELVAGCKQHGNNNLHLHAECRSAPLRRDNDDDRAGGRTAHADDWNSDLRAGFADVFGEFHSYGRHGFRHSGHDFGQLCDGHSGRNRRDDHGEQRHEHGLRCESKRDCAELQLSADRRSDDQSRHRHDLRGHCIPAFTASVPAGLTVIWYDAATGGTVLLANNLSFTPTMAGTYFAEAFDAVTGCRSATRTQ
jgi:hypothetical protein